MGSNAVTDSARRRCEIDGVLAEELGNVTGSEKL